MITIFWLSLLGLAYPLVFYPGLMVALGVLAPRRIRRRDDTPSVALIIAACNEERSIGAMMEQVQTIDYPPDRLEIVVASDEGSTDGTHAIVAAHAARGVRLIVPPPGSIGKNVSLDAAVAATRGDILVFADATARFAPAAIRQLATDFGDPRIGCVSAAKSYWLERGFGPQSYASYWNLERLIDCGSSALGYVPNASGGFHALRRELYASVPGFMTRDLIDPAQVLGQGLDAVLDPGIPYLDAPWVGTADVYGARVRITQRTLASTGYVLGRLWQGGRLVAIVQFVSHKLLRWFLWLPAAGLLLSSMVLAGRGDSRFLVLAAIQVVAYAAVPPTLHLAERGHNLPIVTSFAFFVVSLVAMAHAFGLFLLGRRRTTWRLRREAARPNSA